jgi:hypothetical protein
MATLKQIVNGDYAGLTWLELEDSDGKTWKYNQGRAALDGAVVHIAQRPDRKLEILVAGDGQPRLRQDGPGLPGKMVVSIQPVSGAGTEPGFPIVAGWSGGVYEYDQD